MGQREAGDAVTLNIRLKNGSSSVVRWPYEPDELLTGYSVSIKDATGREVRMKERPEISPVGVDEMIATNLGVHGEAEKQLSLERFFSLRPGVYSVSATHMAEDYEDRSEQIRIKSNLIQFRIVPRSLGTGSGTHPTGKESGSIVQWSRTVAGIKYGIMPAKISTKAGGDAYVQIVIWNKTANTIICDGSKDLYKITVTGPDGERIISTRKPELPWSSGPPIPSITPNRICTGYYSLNQHGLYEFPTKGKYLIQFVRLALKPRVAPPGYNGDLLLTPPGAVQKPATKPEKPRLVPIGTVELEVT